MTVTVTSALAGPATARYSNVYGALVDLGVLSGLGAQDVTGSGDPVAPILNASQFFAPLKSTLVLTRGSGNPTYTRATTAWEFDNEGKLITVPSGGARFGGGRMVRNFITYTQDLSNAAWTKRGTCAITANDTTAPDGTVTADLVSGIGVPGTNDLFQNNATIPSGAVTQPSLYIKRVTASGNLRISNPADSSKGRWQVNLALLSDAWERITKDHAAVTVQTVFSGAGGGDGLIFSCEAGGPLSCHIWGIQLENVTGQADQTASEYVSAGVLSAPYHGAGTDGVKWFETNKAGTYISESSLLGYHAEGARTNSLLYSRDLTNAAWVKTNVTAVKTATGIDNAPDSASTITASAADATILQTLSLAAAARSFSAYVKRRTGTGNIYMTRDGGTNWTDITASVGSSWTRVKIENTSVLNPSVGFKIATSGDAIDVDVCQDEAGAFISGPIITTTTAVTRNADALTYAFTGNVSDNVGTVLASATINTHFNLNNRVIGFTNNTPLCLISNYKIQSWDGTGAVNSTTAITPNVTFKAASNWSGSTRKMSLNSDTVTSSSYDGGWNATSIGIGTGSGGDTYGYVKQAYIWQSALTDAQLQQVTA